MDELKKDPILDEATRRFKRCVDWEAEAQNLFMADYKFANADSDNGYQWPNDLRQNRDIDSRPCLTINKVRQHNFEIINESKQNKPGINVKAVGNGATYESAQVLAGLIRHIEYQSDAATAYNTATEFQVTAGIGYIRVETDFAADDSFDQEIYIRRVIDPLSIYMDPDAKMLDKSDARFAFVFDDVDQEEFDEKYPEYAGKAGQTALGSAEGWVTSDTVRVCEYFRRAEEKDELLNAKLEGMVEPITVLASTLPAEVLASVKDHPDTRVREVTRTKVEWYFIVGQEIMEKKDWAGRYIPIVPVIGEETIIEGVLDRKGHTRAMKDPQRIYNYWTSSAVEHVALQGKTPWVAPIEAIEGYENYWKTANTVNYAILPYNALDSQGRPLQVPQRPQPPQMAPAYLQGMQIAQGELAMVSGQYAPNMGEPGNERTGQALFARQRKGDVATYHYTENLGVAVKHVGRIVLDLIPKIYDTKRILMVIAEDGEDLEVKIDPSARKAFEVRKGHNNEVVARILNPNVGTYEVEAQLGASYGTRRQETFAALTQIITQAPGLTQVIGDILLKAGDFPMADEAAMRLRRMVPKQALGEGPSETEQALGEQLKALQTVYLKSVDQIAMYQLKLKAKDQQRAVQAFEAETGRIKVLADDMNPAALDVLIKQAVSDALEIKLGPVARASEPNLRRAALEMTPGQLQLPLGG